MAANRLRFYHATTSISPVCWRHPLCHHHCHVIDEHYSCASAHIHMLTGGYRVLLYLDDPALLVTTWHVAIQSVDLNADCRMLDRQTHCRIANHTLT